MPNFPTSNGGAMEVSDTNSDTAYHRKFERLEAKYKLLQKAYELLEQKCKADIRLYNDEIERLKGINDSLACETAKRDRLLKERESAEAKELETIKSERERLLTESKSLQESCMKLQSELLQKETEIRNEKRGHCERERKIREEYECEIQKLHSQQQYIDGAQQSESHLSQVECSLERYRLLEEKYRNLRQESNEKIFEAQSRSRALETQIIEARNLASKLSTSEDSLKLELERYASKVKMKDEEVDSLRRQVQKLMLLNIKLQGEAASQESGRSIEVLELSHQVDNKLNGFEKEIERKDFLIEDLQKGLKNLEKRLKSSKCQVAKLKDENKKLSSAVSAAKPKLLEIELQGNKQIERLRCQRDEALQHLQQQRKSEQRSESKEQEIVKLEALIRERDYELRKVKQHYKGVLKTMQKTITTIECRLVRTNQRVFDTKRSVGFESDSD